MPVRKLRSPRVARTHSPELDVREAARRLSPSQRLELAQVLGVASRDGSALPHHEFWSRWLIAALAKGVIQDLRNEDPAGDSSHLADMTLRQIAAEATAYPGYYDT